MGILRAHTGATHTLAQIQHTHTHAHRHTHTLYNSVWSSGRCDATEVHGEGEREERKMKEGGKEGGSRITNVTNRVKCSSKRYLW